MSRKTRGLHRIRTEITYTCEECNKVLEACDECGEEFDTDSLIHCDKENRQHICDPCVDKVLLEEQNAKT